MPLTAAVIRRRLARHRLWQRLTGAFKAFWRRCHDRLVALPLILAQVQVSPSADGMPGAALVGRLLSWLAQGALWGCLASLLVGSAVWGLSQHAGNGYVAGKGRTFALAGAVGALVAGLAPAVVNTLFNSAR